MKTISKNLILPIVLFMGMFIISCKSDDNANTNEEIQLESLTKLEEDSQFIEYVKQTYTISKQIRYPSYILSILDDTVELTDIDKEEIAYEMGFANINEFNKFNASQTKLMSDIAKRYDLENKEQVDVMGIYYKLINTHRSSIFQTNKAKKTNKSVKISTYCDDVLDVCLDNLFGNQNYIDNPGSVGDIFCTDYPIDSPKWVECVESNTARLPSNQSELTKEWCECLRVDCNWPEDVSSSCDGYLSS